MRSHHLILAAIVVATLVWHGLEEVAIMKEGHWSWRFQPGQRLSPAEQMAVIDSNAFVLEEYAGQPTWRVALCAAAVATGALLLLLPPLHPQVVYGVFFTLFVMAQQAIQFSQSHRLRPTLLSLNHNRSLLRQSFSHK